MCTICILDISTRSLRLGQSLVGLVDQLCSYKVLLFCQDGINKSGLTLCYKSQSIILYG